MTGVVYMVGAGPGDPGLITMRGLECLRRADVVAHDRLVHPKLLDEAPIAAERINVGKAPGYHSWQQAEINALLIAQAREERIVVRLKGGDPFTFGRGGEECQALSQAGIPFEIVPGVTSAIAAPAYAGIPVTHRECSSTFAVVTGHACDSDAVNWESLVNVDTLVVLMGVQNLLEYAKQLMKYGRSPETPVAVICMGTTPEQIVIQGTLADIAEKTREIQTPATIVIGLVVELRQQLAWFDPTGTGNHPIAQMWHSPQRESHLRCEGAE